MLFDKKLDVEHLYAGKKICFVCGNLNLEIREQLYFLLYFLNFFFLEVKQKKISVCTKYAMFC